MTKRNPDNERIKLRYFEFLKQADGKSEATIRQVEKAILRFEEFTRFADLKTFNQKQANGFKDHMAGQKLAPATILTALNNLKRFLFWLCLQPGFKTAINRTDIEYLNLPEKDIRAATAATDRPHPSLQMIKNVVEHMPNKTAIEKRNRALIAFTAITGIRDGALISLKLKHFDRARMLILQNPLEVSTKFSKRIDTFLFPLNEQFERIFLDWVDYLKKHKFFADHEPLFPKTVLGHDDNDCFTPAGLSRQHWANASPVRAIFKTAFANAGLPAFTPHGFRHMIVAEMYARNLSVVQFKAWSQNLGHEGAMTTLTSYGKLSLHEQGELVRQFRGQNRDDLVEEIRKLVNKNQ